MGDRGWHRTEADAAADADADADADWGIRMEANMPGAGRWSWELQVAWGDRCRQLTISSRFCPVPADPGLISSLPFV